MGSLLNVVFGFPNNGPYDMHPDASKPKKAVAAHIRDRLKLRIKFPHLPDQMEAHQTRSSQVQQ